MTRPSSEVRVQSGCAGLQRTLNDCLDDQHLLQIQRFIIIRVSHSILYNLSGTHPLEVTLLVLDTGGLVMTSSVHCLPGVVLSLSGSGLNG